MAPICLTCDQPAQDGALHCAGENRCAGLDEEGRFNLGMAWDDLEEERWSDLMMDAWADAQ